MYCTCIFYKSTWFTTCIFSWYSNSKVVLTITIKVTRGERMAKEIT